MERFLPEFSALRFVKRGPDDPMKSAKAKEDEAVKASAKADALGNQRIGGNLAPEPRPR